MSKKDKKSGYSLSVRITCIALAGLTVLAYRRNVKKVINK